MIQSKLVFHAWQLLAAYGLDVILGDPPSWPHPVRWIGSLVNRAERVFYRPEGSPDARRLAGFLCWGSVVAITGGAALLVLALAGFLLPTVLSGAVAVWIAYTTLATRSLHQESRKVAAALELGDIPLARQRLSNIVSRETGGLDEKDIVRALLETVSENFSDGVAAPLFYLALGGPAAAVLYKAVNTMDSMLGYMNDRYRFFGWFAAKADDAANWAPARLSGLLLVGAAALLKMDARNAWRIMRRDAGKMKSPNAGRPEAAAAGALGIQLGGPSTYFGELVHKPTLGDAERPCTIERYNAMIRLMYTASLLALAAALALRSIIS